MNTFIVYSGDSESSTKWIVNAHSKKEAIDYVMHNEEFYEDETILRCEKIDNHHEGVVFIESTIL